MSALFRLISLIWITGVLLHAWTPGLEEAAKAVANGTATEAQRVFVYNHNKELNKMALHNQQFEQNVYQKCQNDFFRRHTKNIEDAARKAGVKATVKPPSKIDPKTGDYVFNPGTDTDVDVVPLNTNQKLDLKKIREVEDNFQDIVRTQSTNAKVTPPKGKIDTDTDFLPNPHHTTDADFAEITRHINNNGGTAYTSRESALAQSKLSSNQTIDLDEASKFSQEMDKLAQKKFDHSSDLRKQANAVRQSDPARAKQLDLEADLSDFQGSKYLERQHQLNNKLRQQHGLEPKPRDITGLDEAMDTIKDAGRGAGTRIDAAKVKALKDQAMQKSTEDLIETLRDIAKVDPSKASRATEAIAKKLSTLPPSKQGSMIAELERTMGSEAAKKIVQQTKALNQAKKASTAASQLDDIKDLSKTDLNFGKKPGKAPGMTKVKVVMTVGGALLIGKTGYDISIANVKPDDTLLDWFANMYKNSLWYGTGIGTAYEQAEAEELERYHKEFAGGQDPSLVKHITVTLLKTGTYMGRDAIIGLLYLPDTIAQALSWSWGEVTGTNKINAYTEAQNQLANAMKKVILEKRAFNDAMNMVKKMGLHAEDAKPFLDCLCRGCGGSLGGFFNPACTSDIGHGPCQCNGPLTIWKTPVPSGKEAQYDCFNEVARMRYNEAQAIFDAWRQRALEENAKSVEKELQEIKESYTEALKDEELARQKSDKIAAIKDLLLERDLDGVRALYGPCLQNHAERNVEKGQLDRAIDNVDRALNKVGMRDFQNESNAKQRKSQFEKWKESWGKAKEEQFRQIDGNLSKNNVQMARGLLERLEYDMVKNPLRPLPHAVQDPDFMALKERVNGGLSRYEEARKEAWAEATKFEKARDRRNAIPVLDRFLKGWEHPIGRDYDLKRQIEYDSAEVAKADRLRKNGEQFEKNRDYADAINAYKQSLAIQIDPKLEAKIAALEEYLGLEAEKKARQAEEKRRADAEMASAGLSLTERFTSRETNRGEQVGTRQTFDSYDTFGEEDKKSGYEQMSEQIKTGMEKQKEILVSKQSSSHGFSQPTSKPSSKSSAHATASSAASSVSHEQSIMNTGNIAAVENHPKNPTTFSIGATCKLVSITNYHWNYAKGSKPGTIGVRDASGKTYGPWKCVGRPGQGGVKDAYWIATPGIALPSGTYTIIDSEPTTWAHNSGSGYKGMSDVVADCGGSVQSGSTSLTPNETRSSSSKSSARSSASASSKPAATVSFAGTMQGSWQGSGTYYTQASGTFTMTIAPSGKVSVRYEGDDDGEFTGQISDTGSIDLKMAGGSSGSFSWKGTIKKDAKGKLSGSGTWSDEGAHGTWTSQQAAATSKPAASSFKLPALYKGYVTVTTDQSGTQKFPISVTLEDHTVGPANLQQYKYNVSVTYGFRYSCGARRIHVDAVNESAYGTFNVNTKSVSIPNLGIFSAKFTETSLQGTYPRTKPCGNLDDTITFSIDLKRQ